MADNHFEFQIDEALKARELLKPHLQPTPLVCLDGAFPIYAKLEFKNPTRSFKDRPAFYGILKNLDHAKSVGVLAASSGNYAQAIAHAGTKLGVKTRIVMTSKTTAFKVERTRNFGGEVIFSGETFESREKLVNEMRVASGAVFLHPFDCEETMYGDATMALEILDQLSGDFDIYVPTSGGGLLAATAAVIKHFRPGCRIIGVQQKNNSSLEKSFRSKTRVKVPPFESICDSLIAVCPGEKTFPMILKYVDEVVSPTEEEIVDAMKELENKYQMRVEPGSATSLAALKKYSSSRKSILVLTGANVSA